jgi:hypothetical protein
MREGGEIVPAIHLMEPALPIEIWTNAIFPRGNALDHFCLAHTCRTFMDMVVAYYRSMSIKASPWDVRWLTYIYRRVPLLGMLHIRFGHKWAFTSSVSVGNRRQIEWLRERRLFPRDLKEWTLVADVNAVSICLEHYSDMECDTIRARTIHEHEQVMFYILGITEWKQLDDYQAEAVRRTFVRLCRVDVLEALLPQLKEDYHGGGANTRLMAAAFSTNRVDMLLWTWTHIASKRSASSWHYNMEHNPHVNADVREKLLNQFHATYPDFVPPPGPQGVFYTIIK